MKHLDLLNKIKGLEKRDDNIIPYNSLIEEAIKICIRAIDNDKPLIVIKENAYLSSNLYEILLSYFDKEEIVFYNPEESLRSEEIASSFENRADRVLALYRIVNEKNIKLVVTTPYGFIRHLPIKSFFIDEIIDVKKGQKIEREEIVSKLIKLGYEKTNHVDKPMTYAVRGFIVDVFSVNYQNPIRIEFFDDEIYSIRFFDINSQSTISETDEVSLIPAKDIFFSDEDKEYLKKNCEVLSGEMELNLEYIYKDIYEQSQYVYTSFFKNLHLIDYVDGDIYLSDKNNIKEHLKLLSNETVAYIQEMHEDKRLPLKFYVYGDFDRLLLDKDIIEGNQFKYVDSIITENNMPSGSLDYLVNIINGEHIKYKILVVDNKQCSTLINTLTSMKIKYNLVIDNHFEEGINVFISDIYHGFEVPKLGIKIYADKELFNNKIKVGKFAGKYSDATKLDTYEDLKNGDYVVHDQYGIGQYIDIETREVNGIMLDYLKIIYRGNDELLVPLSQFHLVRKYVSKEGVVPKLHKLGTKDWENTKSRVEADVEGIAKGLIELYAQREECIGFKFKEDDEIQEAFEKEFMFDLTNDQVKAIEEVKKDMMSDKPMDRLLCGDVGFGKTEVAMRAAMKACLSDKQVVYLCPTTVLSMQHYKTFTDRFANYPVRIELLNRFVDTKKQNEIINDLKNGKVDILIGTHRVLSNDIVFKDLGLLIIDEEQRFGVVHKEKIKEIKKTIDVLSLSATPIPRTLQMSLIGIRGLSTLNTPPLNRYPVQTYVAFNNDNLIKEVIYRELERKGQVFYLFNDVRRIYSVAKKLQSEIPFAKVEVTHGQMSSEQIEDVMYRFYNNEINVLVCTTIVETGLDIPNANTIIIDNAQNFGLAQLYQIKGRVGRSDRIAYAYLLIPEKKSLTETSTKRLNAIKEFTSLGSGFKIAMRDLTIRGAGDILGAKQSGFIDNVGLDLYLSMLNSAIKKQKGIKEEKKEKKEVVNIPMSGYLPDSFNENDYEKLAIYHELESIETKEDLFSYYVKICDEYGKLPDVVKALFDKKRIELLININLIDSITNFNDTFKIIFTKEYSDTVDGVRFFEYCNELSPDIEIRYKAGKLETSVPFIKEAVDKLIVLVDNLDRLVKHENR